LLGYGPTRHLFDQLGGFPKHLSTVPTSFDPTLSGVAMEPTVQQVLGFLRQLHECRQSEVA
jgi:hypothetical protein